MIDPAPDNPEEELAKTWAARGIDPDTISFRGETAIGTRVAVETTVLPTLLSSTAGVPALELGELLGEGGMGVVHSATQTALQRQVAVKTIRRDGERTEDALQLLREGRVTGLLEHPNVVPVYTLGQDGEGRPLIVMKRIEGTLWSSLLQDVAMAERTSGAYLRKHLRILQQVARALHFAHSRSVLHRDVKPDNVMIGSFGEVYLVDWGIAVSTAETPLAQVPHVSDVTTIEGTPVYMAPEMAAGAGDKLGVWSDVYLLGATLHHVVMGKPPHEATSIHGVLLKAFVSAPPDYDPSIPKDLVAIARKAMAHSSASRHSSAASFAESLDEFLTHRDAHDLCAEAEHRFAQLESLGVDEHERAEVLFNEARFAFEQSLRSWPDNPRARVGRRKLIEVMTQHELQRGAPRLAEALLRLHDSPPPELAGRVREAVESDQGKEQRLAKLEHDVDRGFGVRERVIGGYFAAAGWFTVLVTCGVLTRYDIYEVGPLEFAFLGLVQLVGVVLTILFTRTKMLANATNRHVAYTSMLVLTGGIVLWPVMGSFGMSMPETTVVGCLFGAAIWGTMPSVVGRAWAPMPIGHVIIAFAAWLWPTFHFEIFGLTAIPIVITALLMKREAESVASRSGAQ